MAKIHLDRLRKKYEGVKVSGTVYADLVKEIVTTNVENVDRAMFRKSNTKWTEFSDKRFRTDKEVRLVLPAEKEVIPPRALHLLKSAEKGELLRDDLRDRLTKDLRQTLLDFDGEKYITPKGATAGRINPRLIAEYERRITETYTNYTKKDPRVGVPKNVHSIAVNEVRSSINNIKNSYTDRMTEANPELIVKKKWIQNRRLSKVPRFDHSKVDGQTIDYNDFFKVPFTKMVKGRRIQMETTLMRFPHDPTAPRGQVISCDCDFDVIVLKKKKGVQ